MNKNRQISLIVACDSEYGIGKNGGIPWRSKADFAHFKKTTMGHPMITGRQNFDDMGALPGRDTVVMTRDLKWSYSSEHVHVAHDIAQAISRAQSLQGGEEVFIVGGAKIYELFLKHGLVDAICLSRINGKKYECDTFFPKEYLDNFAEVTSETIQEKTSEQPEIVYSYMQKK